MLKLIRIILITLVLISCRTVFSSHKSNTDLQSTEIKKSELGLCTAIRGNAHYLFTHFAAMARIVEHYGTIDALAGGSSSTMTMFLYESIIKNSFIREFNAGEERDLRVSLLLKSVLGTLDLVDASKEVMAFKHLIPVYQKASERGIFAIGFGDYKKMASAMLDLFRSEDFRELINPIIFKMLTNTDGLGYSSYPTKIREARTALSSLVAFKASDQKLFFREGLINFDKLTEMFARLGQFYAGYEPVDPKSMREFLKLCGDESSRGLTWRQIANLKKADQTCGEHYKSLFQAFSRKYVGREKDFPSRVDESLGETVVSIVSTSIIDGSNDVSQYNKSLENYRLNRDPEFTLPFSQIKIGYWMPDSISSIVSANISQFNDLKSKKFLNLGSTSWRQALLISPAEPGLSKGVEVQANVQISLGGWPDLAPVQILKAAECEQIVYITRESTETPFITTPSSLNNGRARGGVAEQLNMTEDERWQLYELTNPQSSFSRAIQASDAVWCTDWNRFGNTEFEAMFDESYDARLVAKSSFFRSPRKPYKNTIETPVTGCSF